MQIDPSDLLDAGEVAALVGLENRRGISVYRRRYPDFPPPAIEKGRCVLWLRTDVEGWARRTSRGATRRVP